MRKKTLKPFTWSEVAAAVKATAAKVRSAKARAD